MRHMNVVWAAAAVLALPVLASTAPADDPAESTGRHPRHFRAHLRGANEVPPISTAARGTFRATLDEDAGSIEFELSYEGLEGGTPTQAHVHFAPARVNGGVMFFLCGGPRPPCPPSGTVSGTVTSAEVIGPGGQGIAAGEFAEVVRALRAGLGYANVHTTTFGGGEIRGQVVPR